MDDLAPFVKVIPSLEQCVGSTEPVPGTKWSFGDKIQEDIPALGWNVPVGHGIGILSPEFSV
jgi:hypothetical protein